MLFSQEINFEADNIYITKSWLKKLRGLYFRRPNSIVFLWKCKSIHTMFFKKNIDVAFVNKEYKVSLSIRNFPPWSITSCNDALFVIERFSYPDLLWFKTGDLIFETMGVTNEGMSGL